MLTIRWRQVKPPSAADISISLIGLKRIPWKQNQKVLSSRQQSSCDLSKQCIQHTARKQNLCTSSAARPNLASVGKQGQGGKACLLALTTFLPAYSTAFAARSCRLYQQLSHKMSSNFEKAVVRMLHFTALTEVHFSLLQHCPNKARKSKKHATRLRGPRNSSNNLSRDPTKRSHCSIADVFH